MRFDIVLLILFIILVAFGFTISEIWKMDQELIDTKKQAADILKQRDDLVIENQALRDQIGILMKRIETLNAAILEKQNELESTKVTCQSKVSSISFLDLSAAQQNGQIVPEVTGWVVSLFLTLWSLFKSQIKRVRKNITTKVLPGNLSDNYVKLSDEERKLVLASRRNRLTRS
ncbi:MAG: hypothetical protein HZB50_15595 [Chloroflexi bacterium]|nr:hypothetical protein [Chloroflexota bacterium]